MSDMSDDGHVPITLTDTVQTPTTAPAHTHATTPVSLPTTTGLMAASVASLTTPTTEPDSESPSLVQPQQPHQRRTPPPRRARKQINYQQEKIDETYNLVNRSLRPIDDDDGQLADEVDEAMDGDGDDDDFDAGKKSKSKQGGGVKSGRTSGQKRTRLSSRSKNDSSSEDSNLNDELSDASNSAAATRPKRKTRRMSATPEVSDGGGRRGRSKMRRFTREDVEEDEVIEEAEELQRDLLLIKQSEKAAAAAAAKSTKQQGSGSDTASESSGEDVNDEDYEREPSQTSTGRPSRRAAKYSSLNENAIYHTVAQAALPATTPAPQRKRWLSDRYGSNKNNTIVIDAEEEEEDDSSEEEPLTDEQQSLYDLYAINQVDKLLAIRNNPDQAKRLEQAKLNKFPSPQTTTPAPSASPTPTSSSTPATASVATSAITTTAANSTPVMMELSDSDDEQKTTKGDSSNQPILLTSSPSPTPSPAVKSETKSSGDDDEDEEIIYQFLVKWKGKGYLHCVWLDEAIVEKFDGGYNKIGWFLKKQAEGAFNESEWEEGIFFNQNYLQVEKVISRDGPQLTEQQALAALRKNKSSSNSFSLTAAARIPTDTSLYLVKWRDLPYTESTWESPTDIKDDQAIEDYWKSASLESRLVAPKPRPAVPPADLLETVGSQVLSIKFKNPDFILRPYQVEGVTWMAFNWMHKRTGQILADEMGLGKTIQVVAFFKYLYSFMQLRGPFLVVAPLSTIPHWQRELALTDLRVVAFDGHAANREFIRQHEWNTFEINGSPKRDKSHYRFDVCIIAYHTVLSESAILSKVPWAVVVVDEAQRSKNLNSKLTQILQGSFKYDHAILLTGTPLQNNLNELFSLLHTIAPIQFPKLSTFLEKFGDLHSSDQIQELHQQLRPYLLRRMKENVEKNLPPRTEIIINVDLTPLQKQFYRAVYEQNVSFLRQLTSKKGKPKRKEDQVTMPSLMNVCMQLRHVANHPFLLKANQQVELNRIAALKTERKRAGLSTEGAEFNAEVMKQLISASGKFILLSKLLPKLRSQGHRCLIFSQFKKVLDILEDFIHYLNMPYERLDGNITGDERQAAIDRFSKPDSDRFIFLLSTKAGGVGINLMAADTVIIFDSDWNPQQDIQAQARAHRIGQTRPVQIYRLITRGTYEEEMFERSSMKLGLDHAVLKSYTSKDGGTVAPLRKDEIETMLKKGAYHVFLENTDSHQLNEDDIDVILKRDSRVVTLNSASTESDSKDGSGGVPSGASSFAQASFVLNGETIDLHSADFWERVGLKDDKKQEDLPRQRRRKFVDYTGETIWSLNESPKKKKRSRTSDSSEESDRADGDFSTSDADSSSSSSDEDLPSDSSSVTELKERTKVGRKSTPSQRSNNPMTISPRVAESLLSAFEIVGYNRWETLRATMNRSNFDSTDLELFNHLTDEGLKGLCLGIIKQCLFVSPIVNQGRKLDMTHRRKRAQYQFLSSLPILRDGEALIGRYLSLRAPELEAKRLEEAAEAERIHEAHQRQLKREADARAAIQAQQAQQAQQAYAQQMTFQIQLAEQAAQQLLIAQQFLQQQSQQSLITPALSAYVKLPDYWRRELYMAKRVHGPIPQTTPATPDQQQIQLLLDAIKPEWNLTPMTTLILNWKPPVTPTQSPTAPTTTTQPALSTTPAPTPAASTLPVINLTTCANCGSTKSDQSKCGQCNSLVYCSRECQAAHWKSIHRKECATRKADPVIQRLAAECVQQIATQKLKEKVNSEKLKSIDSKMKADEAIEMVEGDAKKESPQKLTATTSTTPLPQPMAAIIPAAGVTKDDRCPKGCVKPADGADIPCEILGESHHKRPRYLVHWKGFSRDVDHPDVTEQEARAWNDTWPELVEEWKKKKAQFKAKRPTKSASEKESNVQVKTEPIDKVTSTSKSELKESPTVTTTATPITVTIVTNPPAIPSTMTSTDSTPPTVSNNAEIKSNANDAMVDVVDTSAVVSTPTLTTTASNGTTATPTATTSASSSTTQPMESTNAPTTILTEPIMDSAPKVDITKAAHIPVVVQPATTATVSVRTSEVTSDSNIMTDVTPIAVNAPGVQSVATAIPTTPSAEAKPIPSSSSVKESATTAVTVNRPVTPAIEIKDAAGKPTQPSTTPTTTTPMKPTPTTSTSPVTTATYSSRLPLQLVYIMELLLHPGYVVRGQHEPQSFFDIMDAIPIDPAFTTGAMAKRLKQSRLLRTIEDHYILQQFITYHPTSGWSVELPEQVRRHLGRGYHPASKWWNCTDASIEVGPLQYDLQAPHDQQLILFVYLFGFQTMNQLFRAIKESPWFKLSQFFGRTVHFKELEKDPNWTPPIQTPIFHPVTGLQLPPPPIVHPKVWINKTCVVGEFDQASFNLPDRLSLLTKLLSNHTVPSLPTGYRPPLTEKQVQQARLQKREIHLHPLEDYRVGTRLGSADPISAQLADHKCLMFQLEQIRKLLRELENQRLAKIERARIEAERIKAEQQKRAEQLEKERRAKQAADYQRMMEDRARRERELKEKERQRQLEMQRQEAERRAKIQAEKNRVIHEQFVANQRLQELELARRQQHAISQQAAAQQRERALQIQAHNRIHDMSGRTAAQLPSTTSSLQSSSTLTAVQQRAAEIAAAAAETERENAALMKEIEEQEKRLAAQRAQKAELLKRRKKQLEEEEAENLRELEELNLKNAKDAKKKKRAREVDSSTSDESAPTTPEPSKKKLKSTDEPKTKKSKSDLASSPPTTPNKSDSAKKSKTNEKSSKTKKPSKESDNESDSSVEHITAEELRKIRKAEKEAELKKQREREEAKRLQAKLDAEKEFICRYCQKQSRTAYLLHVHETELCLKRPKPSQQDLEDAARAKAEAKEAAKKQREKEIEEREAAKAAAAATEAGDEEDVEMEDVNVTTPKPKPTEPTEGEHKSELPSSIRRPQIIELDSQATSRPSTPTPTDKTATTTTSTPIRRLSRLERELGDTPTADLMRMRKLGTIVTNSPTANILPTKLRSKDQMEE